MSGPTLRFPPFPGLLSRYPALSKINSPLPLLLVTVFFELGLSLTS